MKQILACGSFGTGSAGDEAGLRVLVDGVKDFAAVTVMMRNPTREYEQAHWVQAVAKMEYRKRPDHPRNLRGFNADEPVDIIEGILAEIERHDLVILGPGDFFNEDCPGIWRGALPEMVAIATLCQWAQVPYMIYAASARALKQTYAKHQAQWLIDNAQAVIWRDELSPQIIGVTMPPWSCVLHDPVLSLERLPIPEDRAHGPNALAIAPRYLGYKPGGWAEWQADIYRAIIGRWQGEVYAVAQSANLDGIPDDGQVADMIKPGITVYSGLGNSKDINDPQRCELHYRHATRALVTRLHGAVMAYRMGVPFVALAYEPKLQGFCDRIGERWFDLNADPYDIYDALTQAEAKPFTRVSFAPYADLIRDCMRG